MTNAGPSAELASAAKMADREREERRFRRPPGSASDEAAIAHLSRHVDDEQAILAEYRTLLEESPDKYVCYLIGLILEDEVRHHQLLTEMLHRLESDVAWSTIEPSVPWIRSPREPKALRDATRRFIAIERRDRAQLRHLKRELRRSHTVSLLPLVVELMELDTGKHLRILKFLRSSTRR